MLRSVYWPDRDTVRPTLMVPATGSAKMSADESAAEARRRHAQAISPEQRMCVWPRG